MCVCVCGFFVRINWGVERKSRIKMCLERQTSSTVAEALPSSLVEHRHLMAEDHPSCGWCCKVFLSPLFILLSQLDALLYS